MAVWSQLVRVMSVDPRFWILDYDVDEDDRAVKPLWVAGLRQAAVLW